MNNPMKQSAAKNISAGRDLTIGNINQVINSTNSIGTPFHAPPLPSHFVERLKITQELKKRLLAEPSDRLFHH